MPIYHFQLRTITELLQDNIFLDFFRAISATEYQNAQCDKRKKERLVIESQNGNGEELADRTRKENVKHNLGLNKKINKTLF
jgi:hypothetical protein